MNQENHQHALVAAMMTSYLRRQPDNHEYLSILYTISNPACLRSWPETVTESYIKNPEFPLGVSQILNPNFSAVSHASIRFSNRFTLRYYIQRDFKNGQGAPEKRIRKDVFGPSW